MATSTSTIETLESLQSNLEPLAAMHGQHNQLEAWVNDSCQALEKLHSELAEWQNELARKQTELDLREDSLEQCQYHEEELDTQVQKWKSDLEVAKRDMKHLEEENIDQLEQLEQLERRCIELESELKIAHERTAELTTTLEEERARIAQEQAQWKQEFKGMRELLDKQCELLASQLKPGEQPVTPAVSASKAAAAATARSQELRLRAQARLAAKRSQQQQEAEDSTES
ncbi:MAG: hypothetical protein ACR2NM_16970 [Bythopirellula sp.]